MLEFFSSEKPFENESNVKIAVIESNKFYEKFVYKIAYIWNCLYNTE